MHLITSAHRAETRSALFSPAAPLSPVGGYIFSNHLRRYPRRVLPDKFTSRDRGNYQLSPAIIAGPSWPRAYKIHLRFGENRRQGRGARAARARKRRRGGDKRGEEKKRRRRIKKRARSSRAVNYRREARRRRGGGRARDKTTE